MSFSCLSVKAVFTFDSAAVKQRAVNVAAVKVPGLTDNILGMSRKLWRPIMASQLHFKRS